MKENVRWDIAASALDEYSPNESVLVCRENYAKQALMMFYPHRTIGDLRLNGSFWRKFAKTFLGKGQEHFPHHSSETNNGTCYELIARSNSTLDSEIKEHRRTHDNQY